MTDNQQLYLQQSIVYDWFYSENQKFKSKCIKRKYQLLVAGARSHNRFDFLKDKNDECLRFSDHLSAEKKFLDIKKNQ
jgi:hypothetical protein